MHFGAKTFKAFLCTIGAKLSITTLWRQGKNGTSTRNSGFKDHLSLAAPYFSL
jgi:hypothetical protein